jgi:trimeric autotransporter adhesin
MASTFSNLRNLSVGCVVAALSLTAAPASAATCPFDGGASDALNDGVVLTRYALGITGSTMTASTRYASLDPLQVKNNIECVGCALDMNGDGQIDTVDTTIIARHLVGFTGASVTNGLALGAGSRNTTAAVTSFLANGCAVGGAISAFTQGGNAFGVPAVLGTTDGQPLTLGIGGGAGVRILPSTTVGEPNIIGGHASNRVASTAVKGAFVGGGGGSVSNEPNTIAADWGVISGGAGQRIMAAGSFGTISGGAGNLVGNSGAAIAGGYENGAFGYTSAVGGGFDNHASGAYAVVPGGFRNLADGDSSFAAGQYATAGARSFVWNSYGDANNLPTRTDSFRVQAANGFDVAFGPARQYFVAMNADTAGFIITTSTGAKLSAGGVWTNSSDRAKKRHFSPINAQNAQDILRKVVALPLSTWSYFAEDAKIRHIGPMAQDFWKAFGLGYDDKTMTDIDARGVTLAAIQGLNLSLTNVNRRLSSELKAKDALIQRLESRLTALEVRLGVK